jgi:ATP-dependent Lon protease
MEEKIQHIPFVPLRGKTFFPNTIVGFDVGRDSSLKTVELAMNCDRMLAVAAQRDPDVNNPTQGDCYMTGVLIKIKQLVRKKNYVRILAECDSRIHLQNITSEEGAMFCDYQLAEDLMVEQGSEEELELEASCQVLRDTYTQNVELSRGDKAIVPALPMNVQDASVLVSVIAEDMDISFDKKQSVLEIDYIPERVQCLTEIILHDTQLMLLSKSIESEVMRNMDKSQKDYYLREKLHVIQEELGNGDDSDDEATQWLNRLDELQLAEKTDKKVRKEIARFQKMSPVSPDANVSRNYIETILELPWHKESKANINIKKAEKILNEDHYGLEKVKERILEQLAVMHLTKSIKGPILCLVGPPGVGKTSIARSIARATNREFIRMSLGGVRDEAEIRGHRRTYVGAIPGRIINSMIEVGTNNPLFLLDEVDKLGNDFRGDPASALLEVLDPEQNKDFTDHYLEIPFDLSKVMFITTANTTQSIPRPLLDRMEIIELSSYTEEEKVKIAENYLIPKTLKAYTIKKNQLVFSEASIRGIIQFYTREAGVRNLEREIASVCRKIAKKIVTEKKTKYTVTMRNLESLLGPKYFKEELVDTNPEVGVTTGLAWTAVGGVTLQIESVMMPGSGHLVLTGQMGDVMKESAQTAMGYIKSLSSKYGLDKSIFKECDIQIHIPEGATPKDGPSAGVTMCTALFSLLTGQKAKRNIAMTGEITLRGNILPVGGIKEKVLAAYRQGIRKILLPKDNEANIQDIPKSVRNKLEFVLLETAEDAFREVLIPKESE